MIRLMDRSGAYTIVLRSFWKGGGFMAFSSWSLGGSVFPQVRRNRGAGANRSPVRSLKYEALENRRLLAVSNLADSGAGSLRAEIAAAAPGGTVTFMPGLTGTITLTSGQLQIEKNLTIDGAGATIAVSGNQASRVMRIADSDAIGFLDVTIKNLTISNGVATPAELGRYDGGGILSFENLTLENVTISGNTANFNSVDDGGGISHGNEDRPGGDLILRNCILENNTSFDDAGALDFYNSQDLTIVGTRFRNNVVGDAAAASAANVGNRVIHAGTGNPMAPSHVIIRDSFLEGNKAVGSATADTASIGTAFLISGDASPGWSLEIANSVISGNTDQPMPGFALDGYGAIDVDSIESVTIRDTTVQGNFATGGGGGMYLGSRYANTNILLENVTIQNNGIDPGGGAPTLRGGGLYIYQPTADFAANVTISGGTIANNHGASGGGVYISGGANVVIRNATISGNVADIGGGIFSKADANGETSLVLRQSTVSGNSATGDGGGIYTYADGGYTAVLTIDGATITRNTSDSNTDGMGVGGGIFAKAYSGALPGTVTVTLANSIATGNIDSTGTAADIYDFTAHAGGGAGDTSATFSFIGDNENSGIPEGNPNANGNIVGGPIGGVLNANLGPLANNGGPTQTHLPAAGSLVINKGNPATMGGTDQRGLPRVFGARVDMGSVEVQPTAVPGDFNMDGLYNCFDINALTTQIANGPFSAVYDLNGDGSLTLADVNVWRANAGGVNIGAGRVYTVGDANLDGVTDGSDFGIWNSNKFTANTNWCGGNFNADAVIDGSDFGLWNANKFTSADQVSRNASNFASPLTARNARSVTRPTGASVASESVVPLLPTTEQNTPVVSGDTNPVVDRSAAAGLTRRAPSALNATTGSTALQTQSAKFVRKAAHDALFSLIGGA